MVGDDVFVLLWMVGFVFCCKTCLVRFLVFKGELLLLFLEYLRILELVRKSAPSVRGMADFSSVS